MSVDEMTVDEMTVNKMTRKMTIENNCRHHD